MQGLVVQHGHQGQRAVPGLRLHRSALDRCHCLQKLLWALGLHTARQFLVPKFTRNVVFGTNSHLGKVST